MILPWRRRSSGRKDRRRAENRPQELVIPADFRCPISLDLMKDPVTLPTGITYDRESIERWITSGNRVCPVTKAPITTPDPIPNHALRKIIQHWCVQHRSDGVERIPTPRTPMTQSDVIKLLAKISPESVAKLVSLGKESERNRACVLAAGSGRVFLESVEFYSSKSEVDVAVFKQLLPALVWAFPLDLGPISISTLHRLTQFLLSEDDNIRTSAALILKEAVELDQKNAELLSTIDGVGSSLAELVKNHTCSSATITVISHLCCTDSRDKIFLQIIQTGLLATLLELLVDADQLFCERILVLVEGITGTSAGREEAYGNALTIPVVVKKILRVSDKATELAVGIVLNLVRFDLRDDGVVGEVLRAGVFQKLVLVLQVGCGERTKEKTTELLKVLNFCRDQMVSFDYSDFMHVKSSF